ncbi:splicing regulator muscleblind isoform X14 [Lycorma delicatula]|uniref:splicing regulator muscleblind isoform X14 n=1 Tax=Lycorma delicatula TaxID=130591 RepID=UPI003F51A622
MAMVNMNNLLNGKDSRWLQLEVCREFQRNKCTRPDTECKFAHPPANVEVQNGRVTACYDSIKGRCNRDKPPCKYFHPPQHLKDQLLINGRNHLALKNALMQQMGLTPGQPIVPGQVPAVSLVILPEYPDFNCLQSSNLQVHAHGTGVGWSCPAPTCRNCCNGCDQASWRIYF